ncbi:PH domain-containing protein [Meloidogyne graminicola]|uniref:PH domain-containing protein n=1 Tax=Meloidogyne graminicola TaxID=189291 RepID=A0A8S9ZM19_9BILA|nr:PH domain-containing protein [Meloidogyne graminicola]
MMQNIQDTETVPPLNKQKMPPPTNLPKQQQPFTQQHQFGHAPPDLSPIHEIVGQPGKDISNGDLQTTKACFKFSTPTASPMAKKPPPPPVPPKPSPASSKFRPITPTESIIGSLWDDINRELQKYKEDKKNQKEMTSSPISRFNNSLHSHSRLTFRKFGGSENQSINEESSSDTIFHDKKHNSVTSSDIDENSEFDFHLTTTTTNSKTTRNCDSITSQHTQKSFDQDSQLKRLHDLIVVQQDQICQASRALAFCRQNEQFRGGREEVDAQRALLIATERRRALLLERDRVINGKIKIDANSEPKGTVSFSSISIRLSREYTNNCAHHSTINRYFFIVLIKCGEHIFHTSLESSDKGIKSGFIEFTNFISIEGLAPDFVCELEIYSLKASQDNSSDRSALSSKKRTWRRMVISTPLNAYSNTFTSYSSGNAHRPVGVMDPGFQRVGHLTITRQFIGRQKFGLNDIVYPLDGSCLLSMDCHSDLNSSKIGGYSSFLSLYQIVSGLGAWNRFWCVLENEQLNFWRYPEDEGTKDPIVTIELIWCITTVTALSPSSASFPNSMQVDVVPPQQKNDGDTKEGVRMLFAADTPLDRDNWLENINRAIRNVNIWRPIKRK